VRAALSQPVTLTRSDGVFYRTTRERRPSRRHLLSAGLAFCGVCGAPLSAQVRKRRSGDLFVSYICNPRLGRVCVGIVGHHLERCVVEALFAGLADPATRERFRGPDPNAINAVSTTLDAIEADLADLARLWGRGEISRVEWEAAREGLASRGQVLRDRLGLLSLPTFDPVSVPDRWEDMGLAGRRSILAAVFARVEVHRATTRAYDPERVTLIWRVTEGDQAGR